MDHHPTLVRRSRGALALAALVAAMLAVLMQAATPANAASARDASSPIAERVEAC